jgi:hypothetical protein
MSTDGSQLASHGSFTDFLETHKGIAIGGGVILLLVVAGIMMKQKTTATLPAGSTADLSGLTGGKIYVPTSTAFTTTNVKYGPQINSNDPLLTSVSGTQTVTGPTTTTTTTDPVHTAPHTPPVPIPPPPTKGKGLIWDARYTIRGGETLSSIAASLTRSLRATGMPGSMSLTWHDLYGHNTDLINRTAQAHGFRTDYYNWIFPGEIITVPRWA